MFESALLIVAVAAGAVAAVSAWHRSLLTRCSRSTSGRNRRRRRVRAHWSDSHPLLAASIACRSQTAGASGSPARRRLGGALLTHALEPALAIVFGVLCLRGHAQMTARATLAVHGAAAWRPGRVGSARRPRRNQGGIRSAALLGSI